MNWENPYKLKLGDFPGRLFSFEDFSADVDSIAARSAAYDYVAVELGSGSGLHLIEAARRQPIGGFFGFEIRFKRAVRTLEKAEVQGIDNCYVLRTSYEQIAEIFTPQSVDCMYVNFPDPWAKKRWKKHRILGEKLFTVAPALLKPGGHVSVKTDHREYFLSFRDELNEDSRFSITAETEDLYNSEYLAESIPTEFEHLFVRQGLPIHYLVFTCSGGATSSGVGAS